MARCLKTYVELEAELGIAPAVFAFIGKVLDGVASRSCLEFCWAFSVGGLGHRSGARRRMIDSC